jgi:hypothetical protein
MHTENQDWQPRSNLLQLFQDFQSASIAERNIQDGDVPILIAHKFERFLDSACLSKSYRARLFLEDPLHTIAKDFMVINYEDPFHCIGLTDIDTPEQL